MNAPHSAPLIGASELASRLAEPSLLVVDCRFDLVKPGWGAAAYQQGHLPGAVFASLETALSGPVTPASGRHPLPTAEAFAATLGSWGFTPGTEVVAYDQGAGVAASRLWWLLRARGHQRVRVLEGGIAAWLAEGLPTVASVPDRPPTRVEALPFQGVIDLEGIVQGLARESIRLVDARATDRFAGQNETIDTRAGHVPGARNRPYALNIGADGRFLDAQALRQSWQRELAGVEPSRLVMMCGSGVSACHNLLALDLLGIEGPRLYAGSFSEWIRDPSRPVATGTSETEAA